MRILLTGGTGFIGSKLALHLYEQGHDLVLVSRDVTRAKRLVTLPVTWIEGDLMKSELPLNSFKKQKIDAVINLAGDSVVGGRWNDDRKRLIRASRIDFAKNLIQSLIKNLDELPKVLISASAIGFYGERGEELLNEDSNQGQGFLPQVCAEWEEAVQSFANRKVNLRIGVVLGRDGGALSKMKIPFSTGLGAVIGSGKQWLSWIHLEDVIGAIDLILKNENVKGALNLTSPAPVTNREFSKALGAVFNKRVLVNAPASVVQLGLGEMAATLLDSIRVQPKKLESFGYSFKYSNIQSALKECFSEFPNEVYESSQFIPAPLDKVFDFFSEAKNLEKITPPWLGFKIVSTSTPTIKSGTVIEYKLSLHGVPIRWKSKILEYKKNESFVDLQLKGPYSYWHHTHSFKEVSGGTLMRDRVLYRLPMGSLGRIFAGPFIASDVKKIFDYRTHAIKKYLF
jgi:uncharacterized protein (TIGR01777 family)